MNAQSNGTTPSNMTIWETCYRTPESFTKDFKKAGGFSGTDINAHYRVMKMTEIFGPMGKGWGWVIESRWREEFDNQPYVFVELFVWYKIEGSDEIFHTGTQIGGTAAARTPDESYKMAITDAFGKCVSYLGIGADIYLGEFDGKYHRKFSDEVGKATVSSTPGVVSPSLAASSENSPFEYQPTDDLDEEDNINFGKFAGKKLSTIPPAILKDYVMYLESNKNLSRLARNFCDKARNYRPEAFQ